MRGEGHLDNAELAAYVDRTVPTHDRARIESHLADCTACRREMVAVARLISGSAHRGRWYAAGGVAAAAAVVLLLVAPWRQLPLPGGVEPAYRESSAASVAAPVVIAPRGASAPVRSFLWSRVPAADHYSVTVMDASGSVLWETQTTDTAAVTPAALALKSGAIYFWKVRAQTRWDRWAASDLVEFTVTRAQP